DYDAEWGKRMRGTGPYAWQIAKRFELAAKRLGLNMRRTKLDTSLFEPPCGEGKQLQLL
ncbi:MAG TPA: radical SAM protein, partial [Rhizobiaceae bacterium]|nr:radical SAM protein [Rhizobiaceae bacterium]